MLIEAFGFISVSAMVLFYALETRSSAYVLAFSASCLSAAAYAALIGSWPFAVVESLWSVVAFRRWRSMVAASPAPGAFNDDGPAVKNDLAR